MFADFGGFQMGKILIPEGNSSSMGWVGGLLDGELGVMAMLPARKLTSSGRAPETNCG
jgi:hypothetical protein